MRSFPRSVNWFRTSAMPFTFSGFCAPHGGRQGPTTFNGRQGEPHRRKPRSYSCSGSNIPSTSGLYKKNIPLLPIRSFSPTFSSLISKHETWLRVYRENNLPKLVGIKMFASFFFSMNQEAVDRFQYVIDNNINLIYITMIYMLTHSRAI